MTPIRAETAQTSHQIETYTSWTILTWAIALFFMVTSALGALSFGGLAIVLGDRKRRVCHRILGWGYRMIMTFRPKTWVTLIGEHQLPQGAAVLCPNHSSFVDIVVSYWLPGDFKWVIKKELFLIPLFGLAIRVAGYLGIDRGDPESAKVMMKRAVAYLQSGERILTFPEGARSYTNELTMFNSGPARMAIAAQVPIVPIGIVGAHELIRRGTLRYSGVGHVVIHVGKPISTTGKEMKDARKLTKELKRGVEAARAAAFQIRNEAGRVGA